MTLWAPLDSSNCVHVYAVRTCVFLDESLSYIVIRPSFNMLVYARKDNGLITPASKLSLIYVYMYQYFTTHAATIQV
jgi:hypothetical protein